MSNAASTSGKPDSVHVPEGFAPATVTEAIKQKSFETLVQAWDAYDQCLEYKSAREWTLMLEQVLQSIQQAILSTTTLYSASLETAGSPALMRHLLQAESCFSHCPSTFIDDYDTWKNHPPPALKSKQLDESLENFLEYTERFLEAVETYHLQLKRRLYYTAIEQREQHHKQRLLWTFCVGLLLLLLGLYPVFKALRPIQIHETTGQLFWTSPQISTESEEFSLHFNVMEDGEFHEYTIEALSPLAISTLRFDPLQEKNAKVWIEKIEFYEKDRATPALVQDFQTSPDQWVAQTDIRALEINEGALVFQTTGTDPFLRHPAIHLTQVVKVKIKMKITLYKTYVQWLFS